MTNEQLRRENDVLKTDNTQLRTNIDAMKNEITQLNANNNKQKDEITQLKAKHKDEIRQLTTLLDKMAVNNENQIQQINTQSSEIAQLRTEVHLKVSQWSGITSALIPTTHTLTTPLSTDINMCTYHTNIVLNQEWVSQVSRNQSC